MSLNKNSETLLNTPYVLYEQLRKSKKIALSYWIKIRINERTNLRIQDLKQRVTRSFNRLLQLAIVIAFTIAPSRDAWLSLDKLYRIIETRWNDETRGMSLRSGLIRTGETAVWGQETMKFPSRVLHSSARPIFVLCRLLLLVTPSRKEEEKGGRSVKNAREMLVNRFLATPS